MMTVSLTRVSQVASPAMYGSFGIEVQATAPSNLMSEADWTILEHINALLGMLSSRYRSNDHRPVYGTSRPDDRV